MMLTLRRGAANAAAKGDSAKRTSLPESADANCRPSRRHSAELFGGADRLVIEHRGEDYQLRITRHGKLILTK